MALDADGTEQSPPLIQMMTTSAFTIDAKTGKITSKFQMDFEDTGLAKDDDGDGTINDQLQVGEKIGESVAGTKFSNLQVTYTKRDATTHVETIVLELKDNDLT